MCVTISIMSKRRLFIAALVVAIVGVSGTVIALSGNKDASAGEKPPIVVTVENHEKRISDAEGRLDDVQNQTNQNTQDINGLKGAVKSATSKEVPATVVEKVTTVVEKPAPLEPGDYPVTPNNPAPVPVDPWTVTNIVELRPANAAYPTTKVDLKCKFTFQNGQVGWSINTTSVTSTVTCASNFYGQVGSVMPSTMRAQLNFSTAPF